MLNKEEETRLQICYDAVVVGTGSISPETVEWLVTKLKEVNAEAREYYNEIKHHKNFVDLETSFFSHKEESNGQ